MGSIDRAQEFQRLAEVYSRMADEQLLEVAGEAADLTEVAQQALIGEFDKRKLPFPFPEEEPAHPLQESDDADPDEGAELDEDEEDEEAEEPQGKAFVDVRSLVEIRRFRDLLDAEMAKGALGSAGIESFLSDDNMVRMDWFYSNAVGGVKLMVRPEDAEAAHRVLEQPIPESIEFAKGEHYQQPKCPNCGSLNVSYKNLEEGVAYGSAWLGIPLPITRDRWECEDCKASWKDDAH